MSDRDHIAAIEALLDYSVAPTSGDLRWCLAEISTLRAAVRDRDELASRLEATESERAALATHILGLARRLRSAETERNGFAEALNDLLALRVTEAAGYVADLMAGKQPAGSFAQRVREGEAAAAEYMACGRGHGKGPAGGTYILGPNGEIGVIKVNETGPAGEADT